MLSILQRNVRQATDMLTELLDFARLEANQEKRQLDTFDAAEMLTSLVDGLQPLASERGLSLRTDGEQPLSVIGDAVKVRRIAQNLLLNALKYTQIGGVSVSWSTMPATNRWQFVVSDTGPGLDPTELPVNRSEQGEGIGLSIVRQLCNLLEGDVTVVSNPGEGTRFTVSFPRNYTID